MPLVRCEESVVPYGIDWKTKNLGASASGVRPDDVRSRGLEADMIGHVVGADEVPSVVDTLAEAFATDPVWSWAIPQETRRRAVFSRLWRVFVESAAEDDWVWSTSGCEAVAVWNPPGCADLSQAASERLDAIIESLGTAAGRIRSVLDAFSDHRPPAPDHFYLNMVGVKGRSRGSGLGMRLVSENLDAVDRLGAPTYLESSNPDNVDRYERVGFEVLATFTMPGGGPRVTTMWREPSG